MSTPPHLLARWAHRDARLSELGFSSYGEFLKSDGWQRTKERFRESQMPQECICGDDDVHFHHLTYERLGRERLSDLMPLCRRCHQMVHALERRGDIGLDLEGLTLDEERAAAGRAFLTGEVLRLEHEREFSLREEQARILAMTYAARLTNAVKVAKSKRRDVSREVRLIGIILRKPVSPKRERFLTLRLRLIEEKAYDWEDWAEELRAPDQQQAA
jgi:hypothetical protein